mmetsp:Transcript_32751/g.32102  ORF Transcript_32751/g.32102 Transcript_32751/m.32102 type:complete len:222 (+) Transcript_32751:216-881(+)
MHQRNIREVTLEDLKRAEKDQRNKFSRNNNHRFSGYLGKSSVKRSSSKSRNGLYKSSSSNNHQLKSKSGLKLGDFMHAGLTPSSQSYFKNGNFPSVSPFLAKMTQKSKKSRNEGLFKIQTNQKSSDKFLNLLPNGKGVSTKSRNAILTQIKSTAHAKTNSYFNIPGFAYGTNDKSKNSSSDRSSGSRSKKSFKNENQVNSLLAKKLLNDNHHTSGLLPVNN